VSKSSNKKFWKLLNEFNTMTGCPVLLNTSFNNNVEPIVNSLDDAITCFLSTGLNFLVVEGEYIISKRNNTQDCLIDFDISVSPQTEIVFPAVLAPHFNDFDPIIRFRDYVGGREEKYHEKHWWMKPFAGQNTVTRLSRVFASVLALASPNSKKCREIYMLINERGEDLGLDEFLGIMYNLWEKRLICVIPPRN
jgi:hypothetical protein